MKAQAAQIPDINKSACDYAVSQPSAEPLAENQAAIDGAASAAVATLISLLSEDRSDRTRLEAAKTLLDRAGLSAKPRAADKQAPLDLNSLDLDQVQRLLDQAEAARAAKAKPVSASEVARNNKQLSDFID